MLCEECKTNEAMYTVSVMAGEEVTTKHLCGDCVARFNATISQGNIRSLLSSILHAITGADLPDETPEDEEVTPEVCCPKCHRTLSRFTQTGRLGCPVCYTAFREQLTPMLQQIHGRVQHAGRHPLTGRSEQQTRSRLDELTRQMEQAVALEDFERAATLRDQLHALNETKEDAE